MLFRSVDNGVADADDIELVGWGVGHGERGMQGTLDGSVDSSDQTLNSARLGPWIGSSTTMVCSRWAPSDTIAIGTSISSARKRR